MRGTVPITENYIFKRLYRTGKSAAAPHVVLYVKRNGLKFNRLGITVSKKIGCAVKRNRAKRVIKEAYRLLEPALPAGYDFVIVARSRSANSKMQEAQKSLLRLMENLSVIKTARGAPGRG